MASRRHEWSGEIDDLPAELLSYDVKEVPRSTLKDIANRLNADSVSAGNWESLAEKLGFIQNTVLDTLAQQARVQNTYPGLLMLHEWTRRPGSTAHVLLHALREIHREDCVGVLVDKLFELHTMQLMVSVRDGEGSTKFLVVATQKNAPLHASLDNILQKPLYYYDIVGPRHDITWKTLAGELQGTQLSLRVREVLSEKSMNEIYGTAATVCQPPPNNPLEMNIPPEQPKLQAGLAERDQCASVWNQLSRPRLQPPPPCLQVAQAPTAVSRASGGADHSPDSALFSFQPMTMPSIGPPRCSPPQQQQQQQFPNFATLISSTLDFHPSAAPAVSMSSFQGSGDSMEYQPCSQTGLKEPLVVHPAPTEHDETTLKQPFKLVDKINVTVKTDPEEHSMDGAAEHDEMAFSETVTSANNISQSSPVTATSSFMHPVYVSHDSMIHFCNNPTSPQSLGSNPASLSSPEDTNARPHFTLDLKFSGQAGQQDSPSPDAYNRGLVSPGHDLPVQFLEQRSRGSERSSEGSEEEENMQTECQESEYVTAEAVVSSARLSGSGQPDTYSQFSAVTSASVAGAGSKPKPCTYTMYRPGMANNNNMQYAASSSQAPPIPHSVSMDHGGYLDMRGGQHHITTHHHHHHPHTSSTSAMMLAEIHSSMSMDSYVNSHLPHDQYISADLLDTAGGQNLSTPNNLHLAHLKHSRSRVPLTAGDLFQQPRDRRPLTQDHDLLLDDPEPEYTYIDAISAAPPPPASSASSSSSHVPRRSSEGALSSMARAKCGGRGAETSSRSSGSGSVVTPRRHSEVKGGELRWSLSLAELEQVPGWNTNITERTVEEDMSRYINDDGNFIVWRYSVGNKYVISVSHLRSIRHYAVYESERDGKSAYYIFPKGARFSRLCDLVQHCQKHGVTEPTKTFKTPDGKHAPQSSGRFSHVRLKFPIPARRH